MPDVDARGKHRPLRIVYFGEPGAPSSTLVLQGLLRAVPSIEGARVVAVCDASRRQPKPRWKRSIYSVGVTLAKRLFDADRPPILHPALLTDMIAVARRAGIPVLVPPDRDVNHPDFIARLRDEIRATAAISVGCVQIFRRPLLAAFRDAVNLHGATLPGYRGLGATGWSIYHGERTSGYTFHRMVPGIDEGPVLRQGCVPIPDPPDAARIDFDKHVLAAAQIGAVVEDLAAGVEGVPQSGDAPYFGRRELLAIRTVEAPEAIPYGELARRLRAFRSLWLPVAGTFLEVTKIERARGRRGCDFVTSDGVPVAVTRVSFVPRALYRWVAASGLVRRDPYAPPQATQSSARGR